ncbi:MAG TPA: asparaginase [Vicinamibacterales bacterium]|nr:asparaginase [Vicinamibacterales bacterium]
MTPGQCVVEVTRGDVVESQHRVHVAVCHVERGLIASAGNPAHHSFVRSAIKMFQVLPFVEGGGVEHFNLTGQELALCTASHGGEPFHVDAALTLLDKARVTEAALACGPHLPLHQPSAHAMIAAGESPRRIHNNCSGKHAGMIACCVMQQWVTNGYHRASHPLQQRIRSTVERWMRVNADEVETAIDGCGLPTFALALDSVAEGCARFAAAAADRGSPQAKIFTAMTTHPEYVAGTDHLDTDLMRTAGRRLFAKFGAEGFYCVGVPSMKLGFALKVDDGARRAAESAVLAVLHRFDAITAAELQTLHTYANPEILNTRNEVVGSISAQLVI